MDTGFRMTRSTRASGAACDIQTVGKPRHLAISQGTGPLIPVRLQSYNASPCKSHEGPSQTGKTP
jgi:hypothetical protein